MRRGANVLRGARVLLTIAIPVAGIWYAETRRVADDLPLGTRLPEIRMEGMRDAEGDTGRAPPPSVVIAYTPACPFCLEELLRWDSMAEQFHGTIEFRAVCLADDAAPDTVLMPGSSRVHVERFAGRVVREAWKISRVPTVMFLDRRGIILARWTGLRPADEERGDLARFASAMTIANR